MSGVLFEFRYFRNGKVFVTHLPYSVVAIGSIRYAIVDCGIKDGYTVVLVEELLSSVLRGESNECFP